MDDGFRIMAVEGIEADVANHKDLAEFFWQR